jgi:hypothetical protein
MINESGDPPGEKYEQKAAEHSNPIGLARLVASDAVSGASSNTARNGAAKCRKPKQSRRRDTISRRF